MRRVSKEFGPAESIRLMEVSAPESRSIFVSLKHH